MIKHLVIRYFDTYPEARIYFDTKESAKIFVEEESEKLGNRPKTYWEYRGTEEVEEWSLESINT